MNGKNKKPELQNKLTEALKAGKKFVFGDLDSEDQKVISDELKKNVSVAKMQPGGMKL